MPILASIKPLIRSLKNRSYGWFGNYKSWEDASKLTGGYTQQQILEKVKHASLQVKNGQAVYERDSVLFDKIEYSWPLLSSLLWVAAKNRGTLSVLDFGGSLGSSYFQNRQFFKDLEKVTWSVIEQNNFVDTGKQYMQDESLQFFFSIEECIAKKGLPDIFLISCTLPYLEKPYDFLRSILKYKIPHLIIDSTPFNNIESDRLTVQKVDPVIYAASYPCWFLNYSKVKETISDTYSIFQEYQNELYNYLDGHKIQYRGLIAVLN